MFYPLGLLFGLSDHSKNIHKWDTLLVLWSCLLIILMVAFVTVLFQHVVKLPGHLLKEETVVSFFRDSSSPDEDGFVSSTFTSKHSIIYSGDIHHVFSLLHIIQTGSVVLCSDNISRLFFLIAPMTALVSGTQALILK